MRDFKVKRVQLDALWAYGRFQGTKLHVIFGSKAEVNELPGKSTAYIERSNLTSRLVNSRQVRKTLAFSKDIDLGRELQKAALAVRLGKSCFQEEELRWGNLS